jgi:hypothetical protein
MAMATIAMLKVATNSMSISLWSMKAEARQTYFCPLNNANIEPSEIKDKYVYITTGYIWTKMIPGVKRAC